jgi:DNA-binding winged helix-turn-helix (wHTH) protein/TolB-like protein
MPREVSHFYEFGPFRLDPRKHRLTRDGEPVALPPKAFDTLLVLIRHAGRVVEREELMNEVWAGSFVEDANLSVAVSQLRKALGRAGGDGEYVETVPRVGYRFAADVRDVAGEPPALIVEKHTLSRTVIEEEDDAQASEAPDAATVVAPAPATAALRPAPRPLAKRAALLFAAIAVVAAAGLGSLWALRRTDGRGAAATARASLAVLPFEVLDAGEGEEHLGLGLADVLITRLSNIRELNVRPTSAVMKAQGRDSLAAGRRLLVDSVIEGSVQRDGDRVRVTARLVRVGDGATIWGAQFDEKSDDLLAVQDVISQNIADALALRLSPEERRLILKRGTDDPEAFREYVKGRYSLEKRTYDGFQKAIEHFERAIERDPVYAQAYAGLAECHLLLGDYAYVAPKESFPLARAAAQRALEIDDGLADAHATLGFVRHRHDWDWAGAEQDFRRAIELAPNSAAARHRYGWFLISMGKTEEALREVRRAEELDPLSLIIKANVGTFLWLGRDYDGAIRQLNRVLENNPDFLQGRRKLGWAYESKGMEREAVAEWLRVEELMKTDPEQIEKYRRATEAEGIRGYWRLAVEVDKETARRYYVSADTPASYYARLGDRERAFEWLERAFEERSAHLVFLKVSPMYDNLRADPRYTDLLRRMGL